MYANHFVFPIGQRNEVREMKLICLDPIEEDGEESCANCYNFEADKYYMA